MAGFTTRAIHGRLSKKDPHGTLRAPVYDNVAFEFESAQELQNAFEGRRPGHSYTRISNPTVEDFELRVRALADALGVIAVSSGMAAISNVVMALCEAGSNIVTTKSLFGNTFSLFAQTLAPWGPTMRANVDHARDHFALDPAEQFAAVRSMRAAGFRLAAAYHSHPETPARPSAEDIRLAFDPRLAYLIVSLAGAEPDVKAFRIAHGVVTPEPITVSSTRPAAVGG